MAKKKSEPAVSPIPESKIMNIAERHMTLVSNHQSLCAKRDFFQSDEGAEVKGSVIKILQDKIKDIKEALEDIEPKDLKFQQGKLQGYKDDLRMIRGLAWDDEIKQAKKELDAFEYDNALFLTALERDIEVVIITFKPDRAPRKGTDQYARMQEHGYIDTDQNQFVASWSDATQLFAENIQTSEVMGETVEHIDYKTTIKAVAFDQPEDAA